MAVMLMAGGLLLSACGGGNDTDTSDAAQTPAVTDEGDADLYCELTAALDKAGDEAFEELEKDDDATDADYEKAERDFVESHAAELDALVAAAPTEIEQEIETIIASIRDRAGIGPDVPQEDATDAEKVVQAFEKENC